MTKPPLTPSRDLAASVLALARSAGDAIMEVYGRREHVVTSKEDRSPLTEADIASHRILVEGLERIAPGVPVLSEESKAVDYAARCSWQQYWLLDPLDGTKEFLKRNGEFTVNVALIEAQKPVLGVVHAPALARSYSAIVGIGAFREDAESRRKITVAPATPGMLEVVASRSHGSVETESFLKRLSAEQPVHLISIGSSLKLCLVAEGTAHCYPRFAPTMEWDTAAAQCVVEVAGGVVADLDGRPLRYNKPDLLNPFFVAATAAFNWRRYRS